MYTDNPICLEVFSILKHAEQGIGVYDIIKALQGAGYTLVDEEDTAAYQLQLFRKNFVVMNALYQIQNELIDSGYYLTITPLKINLHTLSVNDSTAMPANPDIDQQANQSLSDYYLNWDNYHATSAQDVDYLLTSFWRRYKKYNQKSDDKDKRLCSLQILGLESDASWIEIQQAYRLKVAVCHPDKGGTTREFIEIREAFQFLKLLSH